MKAMRTLYRLGVLTAAALCLPAAPAAAAAPDHDPETASPKRASIAFAGGLMVPRGELAETRSTGLTAGVSLGVSSQRGLGLSLSAEYAPLPPASSGLGISSRESHVGAAAITPRYTLGRRAIRPYLAAGAGVLLDYEEVEIVGVETERRFGFEPIVTGAAGVELHLFDSGGLVLAGRYARSFADPHHELITATGGLVFEF